MREIKFRLWDPLFHNMIYDPEVLEAYNEYSCKLNNEFKDAKKDGKIYLQYTGLKDKNENEIYEGDILTHGFIVQWNVSGYWEPFILYDADGCCDIAPAVSSLEIIGNIYENPELVNNMDCGDHSCRFAKDKSGMRTNGGCKCLK